jgi:hypothetical protein
MNFIKALAGWMGRRGLADTGFDAGISRKVRCGIFGKSRTVRSSRVPERFFVKIPGKISGEIVLGEIWGSGHYGSLVKSHGLIGKLLKRKKTNNQLM